MIILNKDAPAQFSPVLFTGDRNTERVPIESLKPIPANAETIRKYQGAVQEEEKEILEYQILNNGLQKPICTFINSSFIIGGHNRIRILKKHGCSIAPVTRLQRTPKILAKFGETGEIDPECPEVLDCLAIDNMNVSISVYAKYETVKRTLVSFEKDYGRPPTTKERDKLLKNQNLPLKPWKCLYKLEHGYTDQKLGVVAPRPELLKEIEMNADVSPAKQHAKQKEDHALLYDPNKKQYARDEKLEQDLNALDWNAIVQAVSYELDYIGEREWFEFMAESNLRGGIAHAMIGKELKRAFNSLESDYSAVEVQDGGRYDIHFKDATGEIVNTLEIKTTLQKSWTTTKEKYGYAILFKFSEEMDRCFLMNTYLSSEWRDEKGYRLWHSGGKNATLSFHRLYSYLEDCDTFTNNPYGELYMENKQVKIATNLLVS